MNKRLTIIPVLLCLILCTGFTDPDEFIAKLSSQAIAYAAENAATNLYVHLDKTNYTPNEPIWFKAYILSPEARQSKVLYVRVTDKNKKIVMSDQFAVYDIRSHGDMSVPDSLQDGEYFFYAFTDVMINFSERNVFVQPIKISRNTQRKLQARAAVADTMELRRNNPVSVKFTVKEENDLLKDVQGIYTLSVGDSIIKRGKLLTNPMGETTLGFTYPNIADTESITLNAVFKRDNEAASVLLYLRHEANPVLLNVYAEGGNLIPGKPGIIVFETTDIKQNPVACTLALKKNNETIATVATTEKGITTFNLIPEKNASYSVETTTGAIIKNDFSKSINGQSYQLKVAQDKNILQVSVFNSSADTHPYLVLRTSREILWSKKLTVPQNDSVVTDMPVSALPKGVLSFALFTEQGDISNERLFLNNISSPYHIQIKTDQQQYAIHKKVTATISVTDSSGNPVTGNFSIAAVDKSQLDPALYKNILYSYYYHLLNGPSGAILPGAAAQDMNMLLLTKHWERNTWKDVVRYHPKGFLTLAKNSDGISGVLKPRGNGKIKLNNLTVFSKAGPVFIPVSANGSFYIPSEKLVGERSDKKYLITNEELLNDYTITLNNYQDIFDSKIQNSYAYVTERFNTLTRFEDRTFALSGPGQLKEVVVKTSRSSTVDDSQPFAKVYNSTNCNTDYVCSYNVLNCTIHPYGQAPVDGQTYYLQRGGRVIYHGCAAPPPSNLALTGISKPNTFFLRDYDKNPSDEPEYISTIFWNPNITTDKDGKAAFSFFTSDVKGDFSIILQGVEATTLTPLYSSAAFSVK